MSKANDLGSLVNDADLIARNAATLEGQNGAFYRNAANINAGILPDARLSSNIATTAFVKAENAGLNTKILDIGDWTMISTFTKEVPHGLPDITKVRSISVLIRDDTGFNLKELHWQNNSGTTGISGFSMNSLNVVLNSYSDGPFANSGYNALTPYNRGYITIQYLD